MHGGGDFIARGAWWSNTRSYTTSDIIVTTCEKVAVVHRRPCLQHLACCSVNSRHIGSESRFLPTPPAFDAPVRGFPSEYHHAVWYGKTRMVWRRYLYSFWHNSRTWQTSTYRQTDRQTDAAWRHKPRLCVASRGKNRYSDPIPGFIAYSATANCYQHDCRPIPAYRSMPAETIVLLTVVRPVVYHSHGASLFTAQKATHQWIREEKRREHINLRSDRCHIPLFWPAANLAAKQVRAGLRHAFDFFVENLVANLLHQSRHVEIDAAGSQQVRTRAKQMECRKKPGLQCLRRPPSPWNAQVSVV